MKQAYYILIQELKILAKDRQALALLFVMPLALIVFLTLALQDVYQGKVSAQRKLLIVTQEACDKTESPCGLLVSKLKNFKYDIDLQKALPEKPSQDLALVLPANINHTVELLQKRQALKVDEQVQLLFNPVIDQSSRALVEGHLMMALQGILIGRLDTELKDSPMKIKITDVSTFEGLVTSKAFGGVVLPNPIQQSVPAWTLFGMFFILIPLTNSMIRDRQSGVFKRLLSFPISKGSLIVGKILPFLIINILQFALMFAVGFILLPKWTGLQIALDFDWLALALVTLASAMAATSYALLISCFAKSSEQAHAFGAFSVVILAILGGVMIPRLVMPAFMQNIGVISPLYWALEAYLDLIVRKLSLASVAPKILLLMTFSLLAAVISGLRFRWQEGE
jgi:ABC-2 type transport system permease protein